MPSSVIARSELKKNSSTEEKSRNYSVHHNTVWEMWKIKGTWIGSVIARQNKSIQTERIFYLIYTQSSPFDLPGTVAKIANFAKAMVHAGYRIPCNNFVFNIFKLFQVLFQSWSLSKEEKQSFVICSLFNFFSPWKPEISKKIFDRKIEPVMVQTVRIWIGQRWSLSLFTVSCCLRFTLSYELINT